jgi:hypothetical protein
MNRIVLVLIPFLAAFAWAQDDEAETATETTIATSCSLFVKTTVRPVPMDARFGQVKVEATVCDKDGVPISDQEVRLSSTSGTFSCLPADSIIPEGIDSAAGPCFVTKGNGTMTMFLINVPFNTPGRVNASCTCRNFNLQSSGTYLISKKTSNKKTNKKKK